MYSSSVMLWEMLSGRRWPFSRRDERQAAAPPSFYQKGISSALVAIVRRGLESNPELHFATARDMAVALEDQSITVSATQLGDWVRRLWGNGLEVRSRQIASIENGARHDLLVSAAGNEETRRVVSTGQTVAANVSGFNRRVKDLSGSPVLPHLKTSKASSRMVRRLFHSEGKVSSRSPARTPSGDSAKR